MVRKMCFTCSKCKSTIFQSFTNNKFVSPRSCSTDGCRSHSFYPEKSTCDMVDVQKIRIQEDDLGSNNLPRYLDCELREDLVGTCAVGTQVCDKENCEAMRTRSPSSFLHSSIKLFETQYISYIGKRWSCL